MLNRIRPFNRLLARFATPLKNRYGFKQNGSYDTSAHLDSAEKHVLQRLQQGKLLVKNISHKPSLILNRSSWPENISQLVDYQKRPPSKPRENDPHYRLDHLSANIVYFSPDLKMDGTQTPQYTHTKETSTTLISHRLHTTTYNHQHLIPVGNLYDIDYCVIQAMFNRSACTSVRNWVAKNPFQVDLYKLIYFDLFKIAYQDPHSFKAHVDDVFNTKTNEVLAELSRESSNGILVDLTKIHASCPEDPIAEKHKEPLEKACQLARDRRSDLERLFNKKIPILFYNSKKQTVRVYTQEQQKAHEDAMKLKAKCA